MSPAPAEAQPLQAQPFITGASFPVGFVADPTSTTRHFVVEQRGLIRVAVNGVLQATPFLDLSSVVSTVGEQGLLGLAFDPFYASNQRFFVFFTRLDDPMTVENESGGLVLSRFLVTANPLVANPSSRFDIRWGATDGPTYIAHSQFTNHNGGNLQFGPDGYLYVAVGDGGGANDPNNNAQNPNTFLGKILRLDVLVSGANEQGYQVPPDNPFVDNVPIDALPEIWSMGLRNPWRFSFDDPLQGGNGALIIGDVGQGQYEEVNYEPAGQGGRNYGWRIREGAHPNVAVPPTSPAFEPLTEPVFEYSHVPGQSALQGESITGGYVYRGSDLSATWRGRYFFADFIAQRVWSAQVDPSTGAFSNIVDHSAAFGTGNVSSFGVDTRGELYIVRYAGVNQGIVYRLCEITLTPNLTAFSMAGGAGVLTVATQPGCNWSVTGLPAGVTIVSGAQGTGPGRVVFRVAPNSSGAARGLAFNVAGQAVQVSQSAIPAVHGDIDNNGTPDILWQNTDGRIGVWLMNGLQVGDGRLFGLGLLADPDWQIVASGDFNRDGSPDVIFQHQTDGRVSVWRMSNSTFISGDLLTPGQVLDTNWKIRAAADMNQDGWPDLIWQHQTTGQVSTWLMEGTVLRDGRLLTPGIVADLNWKIVGAGDINGDGHADLFWQHQTSGVISRWLMNGTTMVHGELLSPGQVTDTNWKIVAVTDFNADRRPDLVWRNQVNGLLSVWLMNGDVRIGDGLRLNPEAMPDTTWFIVGPK